MQLRLRDQTVSPLGRLRLYVCGITPYDTTHLGHAFTFVWIDTLARVLEHVGVDVEVCRNVTDVDDDLLAEARRRGVAWQVLANQQTYQFEDDMRHLRVRRPSFEPLSRDYVPQVVFLARALLDRDAAYERNGSVYFRGADALQRSGLERATALALHAEGHGSPDDPAKEDPFDVAIWQPSADGEPSWPSPWGPGRPGWHAECAAMATTLLGLAVDVHAGGADLAFPHHAYEASMAEAATGVAPFSRSWMHIGTVHHAGEKMAKSTGNLVLVGDLLQDWAPEAIRLALVQRPWWEPWEFDGSTLEAAAAGLEGLWSAAALPHTDDTAEMEVIRLLVEGQDVGAALDVALESGGSAARTLALVLGVR
ncbi:MAG: cysteine--tRNA ligase [Acidimicrobiales bacterium]|nr:cysteine--tRNA ligase [Acidimicrobiales bacterium]